VSVLVMVAMMVVVMVVVLVFLMELMMVLMMVKLLIKVMDNNVIRINNNVIITCWCSSCYWSTIAYIC